MPEPMTVTRCFRGAESMVLLLAGAGMVASVRLIWSSLRRAEEDCEEVAAAAAARVLRADGGDAGDMARVLYGRWGGRDRIRIRSRTGERCSCMQR